MTSHETSRSHFPMLAQLADSWDEVKRGDGVLVSEQLARRLDLALGSELAIPTAGGIWRPTIVGVFPDYGNPKGQLRIDIDALTRRWPDAPRVTFGLRVAPDAVSRLIVAMQSQFGAQIVRIADQAAIKKISTRIFEHTFAVTAALSTLTLVVSAIALLASLTTLGDIRLAQVAPVWAAGVPRRRLAQLEFLKSFCSPPPPPSSRCRSGSPWRGAWWRWSTCRPSAGAFRSIFFPGSGSRFWRLRC